MSKRKMLEKIVFQILKYFVTNEMQDMQTADDTSS